MIAERENTYEIYVNYRPLTSILSELWKLGQSSTTTARKCVSTDRSSDWRRKLRKSYRTASPSLAHSEHSNMALDD